MSNSSADPVIDDRRPRPYRVAPPVTDAFAPWVSVLDGRLAIDQFEWVQTDDALVPVTLVDDDATAPPKRSWWALKRS